MTPLTSGLHEECGVFGVFAKEKTNVAATTYYGLFALQHRGQESCGIVVNDDGVFNSYKDTGLVNDVFTPERLDGLGQGNMAVGHVRYGTTGANARLNAQPILVNHYKGRMALAHNGNLVNTYELRHELEKQGSIFHTTSDTEVISYLVTKERLEAPSIEEALNRAMNKINGAYSLVIMSPAKLIAARDENGFRPLCYGITNEGTYIVASESCALDSVGAKFVRDLLPGEIVVFDENGVRSIKDHCGKRPHTLCVFEYIYFARPDSVIEGASVHEARLRAGAFLALEHPVQADVVPGDVVQAGVIISNSETGLGSVTIQPLIYRLVCSNGMVINDAKTRRNHVGRAATSEEDFSIYSNETLLADDHAFVLKIKDTVRAAISEARFAQVVSRMRESTEAMLDTKQLPAIVKLASSSFGITEDESNGVLEHLITGGDFSLYGLANAVTRFSQDVESYDRATKLEEIGYSVMTMSPALFRQMNRTELLAA